MVVIKRFPFMVNDMTVLVDVPGLVRCLRVTGRGRYDEVMPGGMPGGMSYPPEMMPGGMPYPPGAMQPEQSNGLCLWALVDTTQENEVKNVVLLLCSTGQPLPDEAIYLDTVVTDHMTWHLFTHDETLWRVERNIQ